MKAMILKQFGGVENFAIEDIPKPEPGEGQVLIKIRSIGIDRIDLKTRKGEGMKDIVGKENPMLLGWDLSGTVVETGFGVDSFIKGDEVFGTINFPGPGSTYAEFAVASADELARKPETISHNDAAAATQSPLTAWQALVDTGNIKEGDRVLIHGAAGAVGAYAVQIAKYFKCYVIATASGTDTEFVRSLRADEVIDYKTTKFENIARDMDFILDPIGGDNFVRSLRVLKPEGMIVLLPSDKKAEADKAASEQNIKNYKHILMHSSGKDMSHISSLIIDGHLKINIGRIYSFEQIPQAHEEMENGKAKGKVVVTLEKAT